jgi:hypothetical protein
MVAVPRQPASMLQQTDQSEDVPGFQLHGIVSDDDSDKLEHQAVITQATGNVRYRVGVLSFFKQLLKVVFTSLLRTLTMLRRF